MILSYVFNGCCLCNHFEANDNSSIKFPWILSLGCLLISTLLFYLASVHLFLSQTCDLKLCYSIKLRKVVSIFLLVPPKYELLLHNTFLRSGTGQILSMHTDFLYPFLLNTKAVFSFIKNQLKIV